MPRIDRRDQVRERERQLARARHALTDSLPYEARAVGESVRRYGLVERGVDTGVNETEARADLERLVQHALERIGPEPLLALRSLQAELFMRALLRWEATGSEDRDLGELGGRFLEAARQNRWLVSNRVVLTEPERSIVFRLRWATLTGLSTSYPFALSLNEWRAYYRLLLEHPSSEDHTAPEVAQSQLAAVTALSRRDPYYPERLARGVLMIRMVRHEAAIEPLRQHLVERPNSLRLRVQNHLAAALTESARR